MIIKRTSDGGFIEDQDDPYIRLDDDEPIPADGKVLVSFDRLIRDGDLVRQKSVAIGVHLEPSDDVEALDSLISRVSLVVLNFPRFGDGRPYSSAVLLRERMGYKGELRASGNVLREQAQLLCRCGFDSFEPSDNSTSESWENAACRIQRSYQDERPLHHIPARF